MGWLAKSALMMSPVGGIVKALFAWLSHRSFWQLVCIALACLAVVQHFALLDARHDADNYRRQRDTEHAGRLADRAAYTKAQAEAAVQNHVQVERIEQEQKRITDDVESRYRSDLARLRGMHQATPADQSPSDRSGSPQGGTAPGGPDGQVVPLPAGELLRAQELELQLNSLIDWVSGQSAIDPNTN